MSTPGSTPAPSRNPTPPRDSVATPDPAPAAPTVLEADPVAEDVEGGNAEEGLERTLEEAENQPMEVDGGCENGGTVVGGPGGGGGGDQTVTPATVFRIRLKQPPDSLRHKMRVPELCRHFSAAAWCRKLNIIACASETCARLPSSIESPPFWIPIHFLNPERPTECSVFNVRADCPRDFVQFMEWSPVSCPRALLVATFYGRATIWTQNIQGHAIFACDATSWVCEHEWRQDLAVVTKWLSGSSSCRWLPSNSNASASLMSFEDRFLQQEKQTSVKWPNILCVCSVYSSGSVQLRWAQWPSRSAGAPKWCCTSEGLLGAGPSGIMAADAIITESGSLHVAGVPLVNPSTVVVWDVMPGPGNGFQMTAKISTTSNVPPSMNLPSWTGFAPLATYLLNLQEYFASEEMEEKKPMDIEASEVASIHCFPVSNFSAYVSPEAAAQSATTTTWGSSVTAVAFDPTCGGSVISVVIVEGQYMSPYDPDEGPCITGWRVQYWESSLQPIVLHPIFGNSSGFAGQPPPMQTVWSTKASKSIPPMDDLRNPQLCLSRLKVVDDRFSSESSVERGSRLSFDPYDLPNDDRQLAKIVYSANGSEVAVAFIRGGVHVFSGPDFNQVDSYQVNVGPTIATPAFSSNGCCLASIWHDAVKDRTILKIIRVLPPAIPSAQVQVNSAFWERAIADRFWWSLLVGVDWWDAVGCTQSAAEDGIVSLNSVIAVLDADFHSLPSMQHRQHHGPNLDRIKCRLLEGTNAHDVRALVLDMQSRLLLDMLGKGIESAMVNPSTLLPEPWLASIEMLSSIDSEKMIVDPPLVPSIQAYVDAVLDLTSHFITRLRRYASFCRTLATHAVGASSAAGSGRNMVASPPQNSPSPSTNQGAQSGGGSSQMQEWFQGCIAKISSNTDGSGGGGSGGSGSGVSAAAPPNPISVRTPSMPISINTGTFPGTPAVRLIGDCHFLRRLCQLLLFCLVFRRRQIHRSAGAAQKIPDSTVPKGQQTFNTKSEESGSVARANVSTVIAKTEDGQSVQTSRAGQVVAGGAKVLEEGSSGKSPRIGSGNAGQGYTLDEVRVLFLILVDLCRRTSGLQHPLPASQVGSSNITIQLHYIDGNYTVLPEVVEASLGPHMQSMPRPRGADAAGLLLRELELHPPAEEWHRRNMFGGPWSDTHDLGPLDKALKSKKGHRSTTASPVYNEQPPPLEDYSGIQSLWPRKRRMSERDAAFGLKTSVGLGSYIGLMGSRRDVISIVWKAGLDAVWYKCVRCLRQTSAFPARGQGQTPGNEREAWWASRWAHGCPMCGGTWVKFI